MIKKTWVHKVILWMAMDHRVMRWKYPLKLTDHYVVMVLSPIVVACDEVHR